MRKPRVIVNCVANRYTLPDERIIEVVFPDGKGCLIRLYSFGDGSANTISVQRADDGIIVHAPTRAEGR